jgi:hypothetical protein
MWSRKVGVLLAVALGGAAACGGGTGPSADSLVGTWRATKAEVVSVANPSTKVDLVATGGAVRLVLTEAKTFTLTVTTPGGSDEITTGTWSSSVDVLTMIHPYGTWQCDMTLSGTTLRLDGAQDSYDLDGDDVEEPVQWYLTLNREE